jgi:hypothetical protein
MKKISAVLCILICSNFVACSSLASKESENTPQWDFDHQLQFIQTELSKNSYQLEILHDNKANFQRLSALLLRRSYLICQGYGYKLTIMKGVESVDYKRASPNLIRSNLVANVECPA